jgi:hypothetical protein
MGPVNANRGQKYDTVCTPEDSCFGGPYWLEQAVEEAGFGESDAKVKGESVAKRQIAAPRDLVRRF